MIFKTISTSLALAIALSGCTQTSLGSFGTSENQGSTTQGESSYTAPTLTPEQEYEQEWSRIKFNIDVDVNCDNYAFTGSTYGTITNNNSEAIEISVILGYLHGDGSIAGQVYAEYIDLMPHTKQQVQFSDPPNGFSYSTCEVLEIRDERYGNN